MLDASAAFEWLTGGRHAGAVSRALRRPCALSAVQLSELYGLQAKLPDHWRERLDLTVEPFTADDAKPAAQLARHAGGATRPLGGFADRACFALARRLGWTVLTGEVKWRDVGREESIRVAVLGEQLPPP